MRSRLIGPGGGVLGVVGLALLLEEAVRVLDDNTLGSSGQIVLWLGLGLLVAGAVLLLVATLLTAPDPVLPEPDAEPAGLDGTGLDSTGLDSTGLDSGGQPAHG